MNLVLVILPIPKSNNSNSVDSTSFQGIALSTIFCKLLDNVILENFHDKLYTSDYQFVFKPKSSTNMCTRVLNETVFNVVSFSHTNSSKFTCRYR